MQYFYFICQKMLRIIRGILKTLKTIFFNNLYLTLCPHIFNYFLTLTIFKTRSYVPINEKNGKDNYNLVNSINISKNG